MNVILIVCKPDGSFIATTITAKTESLLITQVEKCRKCMEKVRRKKPKKWVKVALKGKRV
jgi:hypothetical protein